MTERKAFEEITEGDIERTLSCLYMTIGRIDALVKENKILVDELKYIREHVAQAIELLTGKKPKI